MLITRESKIEKIITISPFIIKNFEGDNVNFDIDEECYCVKIKIIHRAGYSEEKLLLKKNNSHKIALLNTDYARSFLKYNELSISKYEEDLIKRTLKQKYGII